MISGRYSSASATSETDTTALLKAALGHGPTTTIKAGSCQGLDTLLAYRSRARSEEPALSIGSRALHDAATWSVVEATAEAVSTCLTKASEPYVLIKGAALVEAYPEPHLRPTSDLDILIAPEQLNRVRAALEAHGWRAAVTGRFAEAYLREEGSCWQAYRPGEAVLEVHFRFWGSVPEIFTERVLAGAAKNAAGTLVPSPLHSLIIASAHRWRQATPRRAVDLVDVCLLLQEHGADAFGNLVRETERAGQQLPVCLAIFEAGLVLSQPWIDQLLTELKPQLKSSEIRILQRLEGSRADAVSWPSVRLAMLFARRPSRAGWRSILRRVWPHPGVLEQRTPANRSWSIRRLIALARLLSRRA